MTEHPRIGLVGCGASKLPHAAPARDLYTGHLFRKSAAYAEATCERWYILSAKHGLLHPDQIVEPYDQRLTTRPRTVDGRRIATPWAAAVSGAILNEVGVHGIWTSTFVVLAGSVYADNIATLPLRTESPLAGLGIGQRLAWLNHALARHQAAAGYRHRNGCKPGGRCAWDCPGHDEGTSRHG